jgi:hypothetical protein
MNKVTPDIVHKIADKMQINWDDNPKFMDWSESITGKRHLDQMTPEELTKLYLLLLAKQYPKEFTNEDDLYLHRAMSQYVTPERTKKLKHVLTRVYDRNTRKEEPKYAWLSSLANSIRDRISTKNTGEKR